MMQIHEIEAIKSLLATPKKITIIPHRNPDGDAMGSTLGLYHTLKQLQHEVIVMAPNEFPDFLAWLPESEKVIIFERSFDTCKSILEKTEFSQEIQKYEQVGIFGLLKAGAVAFNLQSDLLMLGKQTYSNISYKQQLQYISSTNEDDLLIIFSYTGSYFDYPDIRTLKNRLKKPQIWLISSKQESYPDFIDHVITFDSKQDQNSHPYQLQFIASLIAQEYARRG